MTRHVHVDYAPPRTWEQFEELCADIFQSFWRDPALVRHGRAGQRQNGVDIVGRNGALYPIGLQCKKKTQWPVSKLTIKQIDDEVSKALSFRPALKAFFILTTAPDDASLQEHVRKVNEQHRKKKLFEVALLGWGEIVRRASLDPQVADKHFGPSGGGAPRSPLLATLMMSNGKLEKVGDELDLSVRELVQDLHDWPTGHIVVRQRESDNLLEILREYEGRKLKYDERKERIKLRDDLRVLTDVEAQAARAIRLMLTDKDVSFWLLKVWQGEAPQSIEAFVNNHLGKSKKPPAGTKIYLRLTPPGERLHRCAAEITMEDVSEIREIEERRLKRFGNTATDTVAELPPKVRAYVATPRIIRGILDFLSEDCLTWDQIREMGALDIGNWKISVA